MAQASSDPAANPIRILVVDDQPYVHEAIIALLRNAHDIRLIGQAYSGAEAVRLYTQLRPDLVVLDVVMPGMGGEQTARALLDIDPGAKILVLSSYNEYQYIKTLLDLGAVGYLVKDAIAQDFVNTIRSAARGNMVLSIKAAKVLLSAPPRSAGEDFGLTERERQVLNLMAKGYTNGQIAVELRISEPTVRFHHNNILGKFNVETRSEALVLAARHNLVG
jgi:NarL family two-component system response regulator LiaR